MDYLLQLQLTTLRFLIVISLFCKVKGQTYNSDNRSLFRNRQSNQDFRETLTYPAYRLSESNQGYRQTQSNYRFRQASSYKGYRQTQTNQDQRGSVYTRDYETPGRLQSDFPYRRPTGTSNSQTRRPFASILHSIYENAIPGMDSLTTTTAPGMSVDEMESLLRRIEPHLGPKDKNNSADYTGSRMMLLILTEQCSRLLNSRSPRMRQFCFRLNNNFPTS